MSDAIAGRYELGERLGTGGMSTVRLAFDRRLERHVAVKLLAEHLADDPQFVARFRREALAAARLVHPNIVQVFDFGLDEASHRHYIVMERVVGRSCAEMLRERGYLAVDETVAIVGQACRGLDYAHRNGVVHRDVKPGNLLRSDDATVKLADFGIAKAISDESSITQVGSVLGTASYLAPEQAAGEEIGPRADLYALGVVTYQLLSGRLPYEADSLTELALKQQRETPALLDRINSNVPPQLATAVDRALALDPDARYDSADAMREALEQGARGVGPVTSVTTPQTAHTTVSPTQRDPWTEEQPVAPRRSARRPRPTPGVASGAPAPAASPARPARRGRRPGRARRLFGTLLVLALIGAGVAAAVVATSDSQQAVDLRNVIHEEAGQVIDDLERLIRDNTQ